MTNKYKQPWQIALFDGEGFVEGPVLEMYVAEGEDEAGPGLPLFGAAKVTKEQDPCAYAPWRVTHLPTGIAIGYMSHYWRAAACLKDYRAVLDPKAWGDEDLDAVTKAIIKDGQGNLARDIYVYWRHAEAPDARGPMTAGPVELA